MIDNFQPQEVEWCDTCRAHKSGHCDGCEKQFEDREQQYRSQSYHFHPASIDGVPGTYAIHKALCLECYREDWKKVYPKEEIPV